MYYRQYHYQAYMDALKRGRRRQNKRTVWLLLLLITLAAVYFGTQLEPVSSCISDTPQQPELNPLARHHTDVRQAQAAKGPPAHPGARSPWEQKFGSAMQTQTIRVAAGDTLLRILRNNGLAHKQAYAAIKALSAVFAPAQLRQGHELDLNFIRTDTCPPVFQGLCLKLNARQSVELIKGVENNFYARRSTRHLETRHSRGAATINSSLYKAARDAGLPMDVLMQMMRAYSYDVDFQRDIQPGDRIEVLYEEKVDESGEFVKAGAVLYTMLQTRGRKLRLYRHQAADEDIARLFDARGQSVQKALMLTPIDGARLSSGYGMRKHPIMGYNKMHRGLDFAAPRGTPIMAAGDGIVEYAGRRGTYGHYIRIRHPNMYQTVYAHLRGYAKGMKRGVRVKQGETIGYVGSTGRSTGPHLHFEVRHGGSPVNPAAVKTPPGRELEGKELKRFLATKSRLETLYASLTEDKKLADAGRKLPEDAIARQ